MSNKSRGLAGLAVATTVTAGLAITGVGAAAGAPHPTKAEASVPTIKVTASATAWKATIPKHLPAGTVDIVAKAAGKSKGAAFGVVRLKKGYSVAHYKNDYAASEGDSKAALKALNHAVANSTFYGGLDVNPGSVESGSIELAKPGTYYLADDSGDKGLKHVTKLSVTGKPSKGSKVTSSATIKAESGDKFGGDATIPAKGTLTFKNTSAGATKSPHFLVLIHVTSGTTKKDVEDYLESGSSKAPPFQLPGEADVDVISPGHSMTLNTHLPKGSYAELCFFPDLKTGMPHALMGMIRIVTAD